MLQRIIKNDVNCMNQTAFIVDDHHLFAAGLESLVLRLKEIDKVNYFPNPELAYEAASSLRPHLILLDYYIPGFAMTEWIQAFHAKEPNVPIIVISSSVSNFDKECCSAAGAAAFIEKHQQPEHVLDALSAILAGHEINLPDPFEATRAEHSFTERQSDILVQLARGFNSKEIARQFGVSPETIKSHLSAIYAKLSVNDRSAAAEWARNNGYV